MNLYQKLSKIRLMCEVMLKNKNGYSYKYVSVDEILAKLSAGMKKYGVSLVPQVIGSGTTVEPLHYTKTRSTRDGKIYEEQVNEILVKSQMEYRWVNDEDPTDFIVVPWFATASQADPSQAFGSAMTYSIRYFLLNYFQIAALDDSDPDNWRSAQREAENAEDRAIAEQIVEQIHQIVTAHLETNPDDKQAVVATIKKYAKTKGGKASANYYDIEDPVIASNLLNEITNKFTDSGKEK